MDDLKYHKTINEKNLLIKNYLFDNEIISKIETQGFALLSYLIYESRNQGDLTTTIDIIQQITNIKLHKTIIKILYSLKDNNLIDFKEDLTEYHRIPYRHHRIIIDLTKYYCLPEGFELIPSYVYKDNIKNITDTSWAIFCLLCKWYRKDKGNTQASQNHIGKYIGVSTTNVVKTNIDILIKKNLITKVQNIKDINQYESDTNGYPIFYSDSYKYNINYLKDFNLKT